MTPPFLLFNPSCEYMYMFFFCLGTYFFLSPLPNYERGLLMRSAGLTSLDNVSLGVCSMSEMVSYFEALDIENNKCIFLDIESLYLSSITLTV